MTLEMFLSHSHHELLVQLAQVVALVACFYCIGNLLLHNLWKIPPINLLSKVGETTCWLLLVLTCMSGLPCLSLLKGKFILCYFTRLF